MARILGIDYGTKKCGLAATDPLQIIVSAVDTIPTKEFDDYLKAYCSEEEVEKIVIGKPSHRDGSDTFLQEHIDTFVAKIEKQFPKIKVDFVSERFTSFQAQEIILKSGTKKSKRKDKNLVDKVSAVLILQRYLGHF